MFFLLFPRKPPFLLCFFLYCLKNGQFLPKVTTTEACMIPSMLLAPTIGQVFEIEFCPILPFLAFFILKSDPNYLKIKFHDLVLYLAFDRGPKSHE